MAKITAQMVKELREATGAGPLDIKKALEANDGDIQKALDYLREKGLARANKKLGAGRTMNEGLVAMYQSNDKKLAVLVEVNCETDFVATNEIFQTFAQNVAEHIAQKRPGGINAEDANGKGEALMTQTFAKDESQTIEEMLKAAVADLGESIQISNMALFETTDGTIEIYQHFNKRIAAMVEINKPGMQELAYDVAMHLSNLKPLYVKREDVPESVVAHERSIQRNRVLEEGKPENVADKIVEGRMGKFFEEIVLVEQAFLKDDSKTIAQLLKEAGSGTDVVRMARFAVGEGSDDEGDE